MCSTDKYVSGEPRTHVHAAAVHVIATNGRLAVSMTKLQQAEHHFDRDQGNLHSATRSKQARSATSFACLVRVCASRVCLLLVR